MGGRRGARPRRLAGPRLLRGGARACGRPGSSRLSTLALGLHDADRSREEAPAARALPPGIEARAYEPAAADALRAALNEAFAADPFFDEATPSHFREFYLGARGFDPSLWLLAWEQGELAGFVLGLSERAGQTDLGWIESLGVRPSWRCQGLGEALLRSAIGRLHARGLRKVGLGVDAENGTGALRLYERVGLRAVRRGDNWVLDLKPPEDARRTEPRA